MKDERAYIGIAEERQDDTDGQDVRIMMKHPREIIDHLSPMDALSILRTLAEGDEQLASRIAEVATARLRGVDPQGCHLGMRYDDLDRVADWMATAVLRGTRHPTAACLPAR